jgi:hypothetical protein
MLQEYREVYRLKGHCSSLPIMTIFITSIHLIHPLSFGCQLLVPPAHMYMKIIRKYTVCNRAVLLPGRLKREWNMHPCLVPPNLSTGNLTLGSQSCSFKRSEVRVLMPRPYHSNREMCLLHSLISELRILKHQTRHCHLHVDLDRR